MNNCHWFCLPVVYICYYVCQISRFESLVERSTGVVVVEHHKHHLEQAEIQGQKSQQLCKSPILPFPYRAGLRLVQDLLGALWDAVPGKGPYFCFSLIV